MRIRRQRPGEGPRFTTPGRGKYNSGGTPGLLPEVPVAGCSGATRPGVGHGSGGQGGAHFLNGAGEVEGVNGDSQHAGGRQGAAYMSVSTPGVLGFAKPMMTTQLTDSTTRPTAQCPDDSSHGTTRRRSCEPRTYKARTPPGHGCPREGGARERRQ